MRSRSRIAKAEAPGWVGPKLAMEGVWRTEVEDFPAFIIVDDEGKDFYAQFAW